MTDNVAGAKKVRVRKAGQVFGRRKGGHAAVARGKNKVVLVARGKVREAKDVVVVNADAIHEKAEVWGFGGKEKRKSAILQAAYGVDLAEPAKVIDRLIIRKVATGELPATPAYDPKVVAKKAVKAKQRLLDLLGGDVEHAFE